jgi:hypothetical protein
LTNGRVRLRLRDVRVFVAPNSLRHLILEVKFSLLQRFLFDFLID